MGSVCGNSRIRRNSTNRRGLASLYAVAMIAASADANFGRCSRFIQRYG